MKPINTQSAANLANEEKSAQTFIWHLVRVAGDGSDGC
jgi:hypothetical protein